MQQPIAEQLRQQLEVRRLAAAGAGAGVLEQRLQELRALDVGLHARAVDFRQPEEERVVVPLARERPRPAAACSSALWRGFALSLAGQTCDAQRAAGAVLGRHLQRVGRVVAVFLALERQRDEARRRASLRRRRVDLGADGGVRADERALVALDAEAGVPHRDLRRDRRASPTATSRSARCRRPGTRSPAAGRPCRRSSSPSRAPRSRARRPAPTGGRARSLVTAPGSGTACRCASVSSTASKFFRTTSAPRLA